MTLEQRQRLEFLEQAGRLTPAAVVEDAKQKDSPLHSLFIWNTKEAAKQYWLDRAGELIRVVRVVMSTETTQIVVPQYIRDPDRPAREQGYIRTDLLRSDPVGSRQALQVEFERAGAALKRARAVAVGLGLADDVDMLLEQVTGLRQRVEVGTQ